MLELETTVWYLCSIIVEFIVIPFFVGSYLYIDIVIIAKELVYDSQG